jgi:putative endonuclease
MALYDPVRDQSVMWYVYVIKSTQNGYLYTGSTNDLRKRFNQHNTGKSTYTKPRGPYKLIYYEAGLNKEDARSRELYLKSGTGKRYLKTRLKRFLSLTG